MNQGELQISCPYHPNEWIKSVCLNKNCKEQRLICFECIVQNEKHNEHKKELLSISNLNQWINQKNEITQNIINSVQLKMKNIVTKLGNIIIEIRNKFQVNYEQIAYLNATELDNSLTQLIEMDEKILSINEYMTKIHDQYLNSVDYLINGFKLDFNKQQQLTQEQQNQLEELFKSAFSLFNKQEYNYSHKIFDKILQIDEENLKSLCYKGNSLHWQGQDPEAIVLLDKALQINSEDQEALYAKVLALNNLNKYDEALIQVDKLLQLNSKHTNAIWTKGLILRSQNKLEESVNQFDELLKYDTKSVVALTQKGITLRMLNKLNESFECLNQAIQIIPNNIICLKAMALTLKDLKRYDEALQCISKIQKQKPQDTYCNCLMLQIMKLISEQSQK